LRMLSGHNSAIDELRTGYREARSRLRLRSPVCLHAPARSGPRPATYYYEAL
jgi:hypothetical protein